MVLDDELGRDFGFGEIVSALAGVRFGRGLETARELRGARVHGAIELFGHAPRRFAREIAGRKLAAMKPPLLGAHRRCDRAFELALLSLGVLRFVPSRFDVPQRIRKRADLLVDGFFSDSPQRFERVFVRHDA
jgi:hypothetical protein